MPISHENRDANIIQELLDKKMNVSHEQEDWEELVRRWEHTKVQSNLYAWTKEIINPPSLEPICKSFFYNLFRIIIHIHAKAYGPDHILTALYYDLVERLYNRDAPSLLDSLSKKMPRIISSIDSGLIDFTWTDEKEKTLSLSRGKKVMDYLESPSFHEVLTELSLLQSKWSMSSS